jgi:hypothetical protein
VGMPIAVNSQLSNSIELSTESAYKWHPVPGLKHFEAHPDGIARNKWHTTCFIDPRDGPLVRIPFENRKIAIPMRYLVAATFLDKPRQVLTENRRGGLAWLYDVAHRNGNVMDPRAENLYWRELPEPVDLEWLMKQPPDRLPRGVSPASSPKWQGE